MTNVKYKNRYFKSYERFMKYVALTGEPCNGVWRRAAAGKYTTNKKCWCCENCENCENCAYCEDCAYCEYCDACEDCENCFGIKGGIRLAGQICHDSYLIDFLRF